MEQCPKCESKKITTKGKMFWFLLLLGTGSILIWLGVFFTLFLFIAIAFIVASPLAFLMPKVNQCVDCNHSWLKKKKGKVASA